ncbi:hypothetical protein OSTOST_13397, partial [Ostertagia ostertagi]
MDDELALLELYMEEKAPTASCLENSLTLTMDGIDRQLETAAIIRSDWTHMKGDVLNFSPPQEQVIELNRILRAAESAKEKIEVVRKIIRPHRCKNWIQVQKRSINISEILSKSDDEIKRLGTLVKEIEKELLKVEREVYNSKQYDQAETHKRMAFMLIVRAGSNKNTVRRNSLTNNKFRKRKKEKRQKAEISDKAYFERMIEEVNDEDDRMEEVPNLEDISSDDEDDRDIDRRDSSDEITSINRLKKTYGKWKMFFTSFHTE